jgi:hypothetical protein
MAGRLVAEGAMCAGVDFAFLGDVVGEAADPGVEGAEELSVGGEVLGLVVALLLAAA